MNQELQYVYKFLEFIPENSTDDDIDRAYKILSKLVHPDLNSNNQEWAEQRMKELNNAKDLLMDPAKRARFAKEFQRRQSPGNGTAVTFDNLNTENKHLKAEINEKNKGLIILGGLAIAWVLDSVFSE